MLDRCSLNFEPEPGPEPEPSAASPPLSAWESASSIPWERALIGIFAHNQLRAVFALPFLALILAAGMMQWAGSWQVLAWFGSVVLCQAVQYRLCRSFIDSEGESEPRHATDWIGMLAASEFLIGAAWSLPLFLFWQQGSGLQQVFILAAIMAVIATRIMIAANFMPVIIAGTGFLTFNIAIRCMLEPDPIYAALGAMAIGLEIYFVQVALRLQATARDMLIYRSQKERLIVELATARDRAEGLRQKAEDANAAKSRFLAAMSHELRTPLNAIMGFSEVLSREMFGQHRIPAYRAYAEDIHVSGRHLLALINDILDLSRIEAGHARLAEEPVSLEASLQAAIHLVGLKASEQRLVVTLDTEPGLPRLMADRRALHQIWLNLLSNAIKFTPVGGTIEVSARRSANGGVDVAVKDSGEGMPSAEAETMTNAFARGSEAQRRAIDGAGLGLAIVKNLAGLHGAVLAIDTAPGRGTEVTVSFPHGRVLSGPRGDVLTGDSASSQSQLKLIALTGEAEKRRPSSH